MTHLARLSLVLVLLTVPGLGLAQEAVRPAVDPLATESLLRLVGGLVVVVVLVFGSAWALRRFGQFNGAGAGGLRVVSAVALGQKERVVVLQVGEEQLLLGVAPGRIQTLHRLEKPLPVPEAGARVSFAQQLERLRRPEKSS